MSYPDSLEIVPLSKPPQATIQVPGSKSITNRALVLAALSEPFVGSKLKGVLRSEDTEIMTDALRSLGFEVNANWDEAEIAVRRSSAGLSPIRFPEVDLFVGNSGTSMRFLTALVSLGRGKYRLDGVARMRERPIEDLLSALRQLGATAYSERGNGFPPVIVEARGLRGRTVTLSGAISSQFLSALLMVAPLARSQVSIEVIGGLVSAPYVEMTLRLMKEFGVEVDCDESVSPVFKIPICEHYQARTFRVEPDASAASYFFAAAAITGGRVSVTQLTRNSLQGDVRFTSLVERMGCSLIEGRDTLTIQGAPLHGIDIDMNDISDTVMTLAAVACFAEGPTTIRNVAHIRHKETDRLAALCTELRKVGAEVEEFPDGLKITPRPLHGAVIETYNDHRMAMSMALIGLKVPGIVIKNPGCVAKTYPGFWQDLEKLRQ